MSAQEAPQEVTGVGTCINTIAAALKELHECLGLTLAEQALVFNVTDPIGTHVGYLERKLSLLQSRSVGMRCDLVTRMCTNLKKAFDDNETRIGEWLDEPLTQHEGLTPRKLILSGDLLRLALAFSASAELRKI
jgi:hypothetical protein